MQLQTGTPFYVQTVVFACSSASGMQHSFTVQLYTSWCHPGLSFVYETSLTIRWLKVKNFHVLTTSLLMRGPWEKESNSHIEVLQLHYLGVTINGPSLVKIGKRPRHFLPTVPLHLGHT